MKSVRLFLVSACFGLCFLVPGMSAVTAEQPLMVAVTEPWSSALDISVEMGAPCQMPRGPQKAVPTTPLSDTDTSS